MNDDIIDPHEPTGSDADLSADGDLSFADDESFDNEIEEAYLRALQANEAVERELDNSTTRDHPHDDGSAEPNAGPTESTIEDSAGTVTVEEAESSSGADQSRRVSEKQVIEAALFVGGMPLTTKKLRQLLQADNALDVVERSVDALNQQYRGEQRPYEIILGEGGYRLVLRAEFEPLRSRVFGHGPKDVKLSQEILEVLSLVAYRQPVSKQEIEHAGKSNPAGSLRQLLRRELIEIERGDGGRKDVKYRTTGRFLSVFGLSTLEELPQSGDFEFK